MEDQKQSTDIKLLKNLSVLYVEDDPIVSSQTVKILEYFFHKVFYFNNAEEALELLKHEEIHLMITDIELPSISGLELCEIIRRDNQQLPIFITSMYNHKDMLITAIKLNLVDYLIKPVSISSITKTLHESLHRMYESGKFTVDISRDTRYFPMQGKLETAGNYIPLTQSEITLLNLLLQHKNQLFDRTVIEYHLSADEPMSDAAYKNLLYRLRKKIGKDVIVSVSGMGIKLKMTN